MSAPYIDTYAAWMRAGGLSERTIETRTQVLTRADEALTYGLCGASHRELQTWLGQRGWSRTTRAVYHGHLTAFYSWATSGSQPELDYNPMTELLKPRRPRGIPKPVPDAVLTQMLRTENPRIRLWATLAAYAGLRCGEIATIHREDVDEQQLRVTGKGDKPRVVATHPAVWRAVEPLPRGPLARRELGPVTGTWISQYTRDYCKTRWPGVSLHRCRHWYATKQLQAGADIRSVQENLGHADLSSTQVYTAVTDDRRAAATNSLPDLTGPVDDDEESPDE